MSIDLNEIAENAVLEHVKENFDFNDYDDQVAEIIAQRVAEDFDLSDHIDEDKIADQIEQLVEDNFEICDHLDNEHIESECDRQLEDYFENHFDLTDFVNVEEKLGEVIKDEIQDAVEKHLDLDDVNSECASQISKWLNENGQAVCLQIFNAQNDAIKMQGERISIQVKRLDSLISELDELKRQVNKPKSSFWKFW